MTEQDTTARRFTLDESKAREWLEKVVAATNHTLTGEGEDPAPGEDLPEIDADWEPLSPDNDIDVAALVRTAANAGIIGCPGELDLDFEYGGDGDGGHYRFLVYVNTTLTLTSYATEMRRLGQRNATGIAAALAILGEAVSKANGMLAALDDHIAARTDAS